MHVHVLFAQRKGRYPGQHGIEALAVMSEADAEENEGYLAEELRKYQQSGDFEGLGIATLEVSEADIRKVIFPQANPIAASVVAERD